MLFIDTLSGLFELVKLKGRISILLNSKTLLFAAYNKTKSEAVTNIIKYLAQS